MKYLDLLQKCRIDSSTPIPDDNIYVVINNGVIGSTGNFINIVGLPKSSKSTFICAIIAATISKQKIFNIDVITYPHLNKTKVCLFDTEQSNLDFQRKARIIKKLSGKDNIYEKLDVFSVQEYGASDILRLINAYLKSTPDVAILIIDGLLDCIDNMNNEEESKKLTKILRKWAKVHDILIITVLHLGKKDRMSLGHIGSSCDRYAQSTLEVEKTKAGTYTLSPKMLRSSGDFQPIEIMYNEIYKSFIQI
jgi:hypothetical protein